MSEIQKYQQLPVATTADLYKIGELMAQTEMFGTKNPAEGFVIAAMCHQKGLAYIDYMQTYHFIKGKVSKRADAIQADFQRGGGKVRIVKRDAEGAVIELEKDGCAYTSGCLWADCLGEPYVYEGRESDVVAALAAGKRDALKVKAKYATPRSRMQMMWARAVSDGVRAVDPGSVQGAYTPEEIEDIEPVTAAPQAPAAISPADAARRVEAISRGPAAAAKRADPAEETPFDLLDRPEGGAAAETCPIPGKAQGLPWAGMETGMLEMALTLANPEMTPAHRQAVQRILNERKDRKEGKA